MSEEIQEICRRLKPVIGRQADRYWLAYLSEDWRGRQELEIALRLLQARLLGSDVQIPQVHLSAPPRELARGEYPLGQVMYAEKVLYPFGLREDEWIQYTAIFGRSGAGKTNTVFVVIGNLLRAHKPFLIFDWTRNYRDILDSCHQEILIYTVGRSIIPFAFNPLIPPEGTDPATWLKKLIEIIAHAYYLGEGVMFLLQEALHAVYQDFSLYSGRPENIPPFRMCCYGSKSIRPRDEKRSGWTRPCEGSSRSVSATWAAWSIPPSSPTWPHCSKRTSSSSWTA